MVELSSTSKTRRADIETTSSDRQFAHDAIVDPNRLATPPYDKGAAPPMSRGDPGAAGPRLGPIS